MKYKLRKNFTTDPNTALQEILTDRGVTDLENFMHPSKHCELDPYNLQNVVEGAQMLLSHLRKGNKLLFVVDCDADGFTSSAILWLYIKQIFPSALLEFTVHTHKQHGLDDKIDWIEGDCDCDLVVVPDAGSYDVEEHRRLNSAGIDCLVIDHHEQLYDETGNPVVSDAPRTIVINNQLSPAYENKSLCGAGMVYKFCEVLDNILGIKQASNYMDLAALGEIADVMDRRTAETNYLMINGLSHIKNEGFRTLIEAQKFKLQEKAVYPYPGLSPIDIAFYIAPLINAITRVGSLDEKRAMFYCFVEPRKELQSTKRGAKTGEIEYAAEQTARVGKNAKARQDKLKEKAISTIDFKIQKDGLDDNNILLVEIDDTDDIQQELTGLIAMAMVNKYHKPCMIGRRNSSNEVSGSIRSNGNFAGLPSFKKFLEDSTLMNYTAGHDNAAGWSVDGSKIDALIKYANTNLHAEDFESCYTVDYVLDAESANNADLVSALSEKPEYFGNHIDEIKFVIKNIPLVSLMPMGAERSSMKISYKNIDYIKFKDTDFVNDVMSNRTKKLTVYGSGNINVFNGRKSVQVFIEDYEFCNEEIDKYDF